MTKFICTQVLIIVSIILLWNDSFANSESYAETRVKPYPFFPPDFGDQLCVNSTEMTFDVIVAGSGTAGSIVASRLSEVVEWTVLLLELGEDPPAYTYEPYRWVTLTNSPQDYRYLTEPNRDYFQGLEGRVSPVAAGRATGGSAAINGQYYFRPTRHDMQRWVEKGAKGWSYEEVKPFMIKAENFHDNSRFNPLFHGTEGYQDVSPFYTNDGVIPYFEDGFREMKLPELIDINLGESIGFGNSDSTTAHGLRVSTARGYLSPTTLRANLKFARRTLVRKVLIDETVKPFKAIGVEVTAPNGKICKVYARHEVILSSGAIRSPQILMLSGIGPADHLQKMKIPVVADMPIGIGYKDHPIYVGVVLAYEGNQFDKDVAVTSVAKEVINDVSSSAANRVTPIVGPSMAGKAKKITDEMADEVLGTNALKAETGSYYEETDSPPDFYPLLVEGLATVELGQLSAFFNVNNVTENFNNIQLFSSKIPKGGLHVLFNGHNLLYNLWGISEDIVKLYRELNDRTSIIIFVLALVDVHSNGYIELRTLDPADYPKIQTNILSAKEDVETMLEGIKWVERFAGTEAVRRSNYRLKRINYPNCRQYKEGSDDYQRCALKQIVTSFYHESCTIRIGADDDKMAPLMSNLKLKGFDNLRVVDASVFPHITSRNINPTVIMVAEKAAHQIKVDHGKITDPRVLLYPNKVNYALEL